MATGESAAARTARGKLVLAALASLLGFGLLTGRAVGYRLFERQGLITPPTGPDTPAAFGAPFRRIAFASGERRLDAVLVEADVPDAPVLVVAHGSAESVSHWADVQALWRAMGMASFVFDYSGFGASTGPARLAHCGDDVLAAWREARRQFGPGRRYVAVGYSLGSGIWMEALPTLLPAPEGVALVAAYSSARVGAATFLDLPRWTSLALPDLWNNERLVREARVPILVLHSRDDELFPVAMAEAVAAAGAPRTRLATVTGYAHADGHVRPTAEYWGPLAAFAQSVR